MSNYTALHLHSDLSILDSATKFQDYINKAVELGQTALASTEHGNIYNWTMKKMACEKAGIKYIHGCEIYLTEKLFHNKETDDGLEQYKIRDNYHTVLLAKNYDGVKELNKLVSMASNKDHFYYRPRITFEEFFNLSDNIIKISACLASPLNKIWNTINICEDEVELERLKKLLDRLLKKYDYYEIQYHNSPDQILYNRFLYKCSIEYNKPLVVGTDTHSISKYKAECRKILLKAKRIEFSNEEEFDLIYKSYDELVSAFQIQTSLPMDIVLNAIENTNKIAESVEDFSLDLSFKYPKMYDNDHDVFINRVDEMLDKKIKEGIIPEDQVEQFRIDIEEEKRVYEKIDMEGFMLSMSEIICHCRENNIPVGFNRGSCGGSRIAYILDIIDLNPVYWNTVFSRFANEDRKEIGDKLLVSIV